MTLGVIIARFQVPELTIGHRFLIGTALARFDKIGFLLGESPVVDVRNPLPFVMRQQMVRRFLHEYPPLFIERLEDQPYHDKAWSDLIDHKLDRYRLQDYMNITLVGGRDCFIPHYRGRLNTLDLGDIPQAAISMSGTVTRERIDIIDSAEFRAGVIWQVQNAR
jgi:hypothetical protein